MSLVIVIFAVVLVMRQGMILVIIMWPYSTIIYCNRSAATVPDDLKQMLWWKVAEMRNESFSNNALMRLMRETLKKRVGMFAALKQIVLGDSVEVGRSSRIRPVQLTDVDLYARSSARASRDPGGINVKLQDPQSPGKEKSSPAAFVTRREFEARLSQSTSLHGGHQSVGGGAEVPSRSSRFMPFASISNRVRPQELQEESGQALAAGSPLPSLTALIYSNLRLRVGPASSPSIKPPFGKLTAEISGSTAMSSKSASQRLVSSPGNVQPGAVLGSSSRWANISSTLIAIKRMTAESRSFLESLRVELSSVRFGMEIMGALIERWEVKRKPPLLPSPAAPLQLITEESLDKLIE